MFILWVVAVAALSVISYPVSKDLLMAVKLTSSGFVVHGVAYFMGILLCYLAFEKKEDRGQISEVGGQKSESRDLSAEMAKSGWMDDRDQRSDIISQMSDVRYQMSKVAFVVWAGLLIFLFSVVLEVIQVYLPCRTFNLYDVVANACGVLLFGVWMLFISHRPTQTDTDFFELAADTHRQAQTFVQRTPLNKNSHRFAKKGQQN